MSAPMLTRAVRVQAAMVAVGAVVTGVIAGVDGLLLYAAAMLAAIVVGVIVRATMSGDHRPSRALGEVGAFVLSGWLWQAHRFGIVGVLAFVCLWLEYWSARRACRRLVVTAWPAIAEGHPRLERLSLPIRDAFWRLVLPWGEPLDEATGPGSGSGTRPGNARSPTSASASGARSSAPADLDGRAGCGRCGSSGSCRPRSPRPDYNRQRPRPIRGARPLRTELQQGETTWSYKSQTRNGAPAP